MFSSDFSAINWPFFYVPTNFLSITHPVFAITIQYFQVRRGGRKFGPKQWWGWEREHQPGGLQ